MSTTPNLLVSHIAASQNNKEVTANASADALDNAANAGQQISIEDADFTFETDPGTPFFSNIFFTFVGVITTARAINLPSGVQRAFIVQNAAGGSPSTHALVFTVGDGLQTVSIDDADAHLLWSDGADNVWKVS